MTDIRVDRLEDSMATLVDKVSEFVAIESGRQERDKHQLELNSRILKHMEKVDSEYRPILRRSKKHQEWLDAFVGKYILPAVILSILAAAGYNLI